jgi:hypothetical protein
MAAGFELDEAANAAVIAATAGAMDDLGQEAVGIVYGLAPHKTDRYRRTIGASTYAGGKHYAGKHLKNIAQMGHADVLTVVYTSSPLGHLLERGTQEHELTPAAHLMTARSRNTDVLRTITHPGSRRFPHFGPGAMASVGRAGRVLGIGIAKRIR